jgi:pyroglutamyl-peptidase
VDKKYIYVFKSFMKILVTGFEPFDKSPINPSKQVVESLAAEGIPGIDVNTAILPVDVERGPLVLLQAVDAVQPEAVLCLGQASRRAVISIERIAVNLLDFRIPDNAGNRVNDQLVVSGAPAAYFTTLPVRKIFEALKENGIPAELSLSAGAYLCNQVIYMLMHHLQSQGMNIPAGFIHLPDLPEQSAQRPSPTPSMSLETMIQGVRMALEVIATTEK